MQVLFEHDDYILVHTGGNLQIKVLHFSRTSASNCVRIYNTMHLSTKSIHWSTRLVLNVDDIWNGFFLHALICEKAEHPTTHGNNVLELVHNATSQAVRLCPTLQAWNMQMAGPGQDAWNHACDLCCWTSTNHNGNTCLSYSV
jgi:hypothetical protein